MPWLPKTIPHFVNTNDLARLKAGLAVAGFEIVEVEGRGIRSERELLPALARVLGFPAYFGNNWDAFDESLGREFAVRRSGPVALIWKNSDVMLATDLHAFVRALHLLLTDMRDLGASMRFQMELFVAGATEAFPPAARATADGDDRSS